VTATLSAGDDYAAGQEFAAAAIQAGYEGMRYWVRHDQRQQLAGVSLFAPEGRGATSDWVTGRDDPVGQALIKEAATAFGYRVSPTP